MISIGIGFVVCCMVVVLVVFDICGEGVDVVGVLLKLFLIFVNVVV